jgi:hypothetical protein
MSYGLEKTRLIMFLFLYIANRGGCFDSWAVSFSVMACYK